MYINQFWLGVGATIIVEIGALIAYAVYLNRKKK